jgi:GrpB-like predicted nucleotidyltransferase (UPF0157 family)
MTEQECDSSSDVVSIYIEPYTEAPATCDEYDADAPAVAQLVARAITAVEAGLVVEHIGSTAVPGCVGKGIIDLMVLYAPGHLPQAKRALDTLGFQRQSTRDPFSEDRPMRVAAVTVEGRRFRVHAHVIAADAAEASVLRAFRDRLRVESRLRAAYEQCKRSILAEGITDSVAYAEAKTEFIRGNVT